VNAFGVVEQAIGEHMDGTPLEDLNAGKNPAAVALGRLGGMKGGKARADKSSRLNGVKKSPKKLLESAGKNNYLSSVRLGLPALFFAVRPPPMLVITSENIRFSNSERGICNSSAIFERVMPSS
jgi:hypothetical protein